MAPVELIWRVHVKGKIVARWLEAANMKCEVDLCVIYQSAFSSKQTELDTHIDNFSLFTL